MSVIPLLGFEERLKSTVIGVNLKARSPMISININKFTNMNLHDQLSAAAISKQ